MYMFIFVVALNCLILFNFQFSIVFGYVCVETKGKLKLTNYLQHTRFLK